jgi:hypothetical protein
MLDGCELPQAEKTNLEASPEVDAELVVVSRKGLEENGETPEISGVV